MTNSTTQAQREVGRPTLIDEPSQAPPPAPATRVEGPISPTLAVLASEGQSIPSTACRACPHAVWFATEGNRSCFCRIMQDLTYNERRPNQAKLITLCDGVLTVPDS